MFQLNDQVALVTGASGGIGNAIARALHAQGATLAISGTRESALQELAQHLGARVHVFACDLTNPEEVEQLIPRVEESLGKVDILINNAGITRDNLAMRMKDEDWQKVIDINLTSAFRLCRSAIKSMIKRRHGRIINISSVAGVSGNPGQANYTAAKAGLIGMSKSLAIEVATRGITVNCIAPGFINSAMTEKLSGAVKERILSSIPAGRIGSPEEIAGAAVYLASLEASYVTGHTLHLNGGMIMV